MPYPAHVMRSAAPRPSSRVRGVAAASVVLAAGLLSAGPPPALGGEPVPRRLVVRCPTEGVPVYVDGRHVGATPFAGDVPLGSTSARVALVAIDHEPVRKTVVVRLTAETVAELPAPKAQPWPTLASPDGDVAVAWESDEFGWFDRGKVPPGAGRALLGRRDCRTQKLAARTLAPGEAVALEALPWTPRPVFVDALELAPGIVATVDGKAAKDGTSAEPGRRALRCGAATRPATVELATTQRVLRLRPPVADRASLDKALAWLARHQRDDGSWSSSSPCPPGCAERCQRGEKGYDAGVTALATFALLESAEWTPDSLPPEARTAATRGAAWLLARVRAGKDGWIERPGPRGAVFTQAIALLALLDAWALTGERDTADGAALAYAALLDAQNPYLAWRYGHRDGDNDSAVTGWAALAVSTAIHWDLLREPFGDVRPAAAQIDSLRGACDWFGKMTEPEFGAVGYQNRGGGRAYRPRREGRLGDEYDGPGDASLTGAGGLVFRRANGVRADLGNDASMLARMAELLAREGPIEVDGRMADLDLHGGYFGARFLRSIRPHLPVGWSRFAETIGKLQEPGGGMASGTTWSDIGGSVYATSMAALTLQVLGRE